MTTDTTRQYFVMDGRARFDMDAALVLYSANDFSDAKDSLRHFSDDSVIVSYDATGEYLADSRIEWMREMEAA